MDTASGQVDGLGGLSAGRIAIDSGLPAPVINTTNALWPPNESITGNSQQ
jgi:hypothetical protein